MKPAVWAVIATWRRPELVRCTLASLSGQGAELVGVIIVDNGGTGDVSAGDLTIKVVAPEKNLGTAGGLAAGFQAGLDIPTATHFWVLDDDAVAEPGALNAMLRAAAVSGAAAVTSLLSNEAGQVAWFPGPLPQPAWDVIRSGLKPEDFCKRCGTAPLPWVWATWASMLITREAVMAVGMPDARLWYQGTDIEYSLRLSARFNCVLAPDAWCRHLPPPTSSEEQSRKDLWSLQNTAYVGVRLPHGHRLLRHLPGNHFRYWRSRHYRPAALFAAIAAFWRGAILGRTAGLWARSTNDQPRSQS